MRVTQIHVRDAASVREYAYREDKNGSHRPDMEDNYVAEDAIVGEDVGLFAILDGHGGAEVSEYCCNYLPQIFREEYEKQSSNMQQLFITICKRIDKEIQTISSSETGSTCCLVLVRKVQGKRWCHVSNLGDTRAVICKDKGIAKRVTIDHKVSNPSEEDRIRSQGGTIIKGRVGGQLAITRALGDLELKTYGVSNIPDYEQFQIDERVDYMIIASDGLWDVCQDQQAIELCKECEDSRQKVDKLLIHAMSNGTRDNTSIMVLQF